MAAAKSWVVTDVNRSIWEETRYLGHDDLGVPDCTVVKRALHGGFRDGVDLIEVNNGELAFSVIPTRGMGIWQASYRGIDLGWKAPINGPVNPQFVNVVERGGLGWIMGFDELLCRCGLDSNGAPGPDVIIDNNGNEATVLLTLHGKIANLPAHRVEIQADPDTKTVSIVGEVDESAIFMPGLRLKSTTSTTPVSNRLTVVDEITNMRSQPAELELLYHWNFGQPFLEEGSRLRAPIKEMSPRSSEPTANFDVYRGPTSGFVEEVYFYKLLSNANGQTVAALTNNAGDKAVVLRYDTKELPYLTQWKNTGAVEDSYVTGIEPGTNFPNPKSFERKQGRVIRLEPGATYRAENVLEVLSSKSEVDALLGEIDTLQKQQAPVIHPKGKVPYAPG